MFMSYLYDYKAILKSTKYSQVLPYNKRYICIYDIRVSCDMYNVLLSTL